MTRAHCGIGGTLFPARYVDDVIARDAARNPGPDVEQARRRLARWWSSVAATCGPATGMRSLLDRAALPLFDTLAFRAESIVIDRMRVRARLATPGGAPVVLLVEPWAVRPSAIWRDAIDSARREGADWALVLAPPFLTIVAARGSAARLDLAFDLPDVIADASAFGVLWTLAHADAFDRIGREGPSRLESLAAAARTFADRVRTDLQAGVFQAIRALLVALPARQPARGPARRFHEALTIVYRVLFLLFAESRDLVPRDHPVYRESYTIAALCRDALEPGEPVGLWDGLAAITRLARTGCDTNDLIVRPFNGRLFARVSAPSLERAVRPGVAPAQETALRDTIVALATRPGPVGRERIDYADLGVEELGAVYERVLDLDPAAAPSPVASPPAPRTRRRHSDLRKATGTFYTPRALCDFVVRRTLAPLVSGASTDAILALRVLDPAMGSGAFLVAACRYLAAAYEQAMIDEGRCGASDLDEAARADVRRLIGERCLVGVDANPVAVQLARLSLWLATLADGKPLGFLDHRLRVGNSLIGTTPDLVRHVADSRGRHRVSAPLPLLDASGFSDSIRRAVGSLGALVATRDDSVEAVRAKEALWSAFLDRRSPLRSWRHAADLWCARWFQDDPPGPAELRAAIDGVLGCDPTLPAARLSSRLAEAASLAEAHGFFHWPLEFADVFYDAIGEPRARPGFDAVIGNPPWDMLRRDGNDAHDGRRDDRRLQHFVRESGLYPSCRRGHLNVYQPFVERALDLARPGGRVGLVLPWGFAVDDSAAALRGRLFDASAVDAIVGLDNADGLFAIHRGMRFLVVVTSPGRATGECRARFGVKRAAELADLPAADERDPAHAWPVALTSSVVGRVGGPTRRIPDVRQPWQLDLAVRLFREFPALGGTDGWNVRFGRELNATDDRWHFGATGLPVIEGKHVGPFTVDRTTKRRIDGGTAARLLGGRDRLRRRLAYRDVSAVANRLSLIAAIVPADVVTTHTLFCLRTMVTDEQQDFLCALFNSYVLNTIVRLLMGSHVTTALVEGLPVPGWHGTAVERRIARIARRLERRPTAKTIEARLQAHIARLYGLDRNTFARVLDGFPLVPLASRRRALEEFEQG